MMNSNCHGCGAPIVSASWSDSQKMVVVTFGCGAHTLPCGCNTVTLACVGSQRDSNAGELKLSRDENKKLKEKIRIGRNQFLAAVKARDEARDEVAALSRKYGRATREILTMQAEIGEKETSND